MWFAILNEILVAVNDLERQQTARFKADRFTVKKRKK
jgi:hypothetical protein